MPTPAMTGTGKQRQLTVARLAPQPRQHLLGVGTGQPFLLVHLFPRAPHPPFLRPPIVATARVSGPGPPVHSPSPHPGRGGFYPEPSPTGCGPGPTATP